MKAAKGNGRTVVVSLGLTQDETDFINSLTERFNVSRSFVLRRMLSLVSKNFTNIECLDGHILKPHQIQALVENYQNEGLAEMYPELVSS